MAALAGRLPGLTTYSTKPLDHERVVEQVSTDARPIAHDGNAEFAQVTLRTDAGTHQDRR